MLRPYQQQLKSEIYGAWNCGARNVLAVAPTGSGKTVLFGDIITDNRAPTVAIAHRSELVTQMSLALARNNVKHRVIGSSSTQRNCRALHMAELGRNWVDPNSRVAAAGVDTLIRLDPKEAWFKEVTLWVTDECFPAGTMVGDRAIETLRVGDLVPAFNEASGKIEFQPVVRLFRNPSPKYMVRIATSSHHVLECTSDHPFYTHRGWVAASNLTLDDEVLSYEMYAMQHSDLTNDRIAAISLEKDRSNILHNGMWDDLSRSPSKTSCKENFARSIMYRVRQSLRFIGASLRTVVKNWTSLLLEGLLHIVQKKNIIRNDVSDKSKICIRTNEEKQSDVSVGDSKKSKCDDEGSGVFTKRTWGKWTRTYAARVNTIRIAITHWIRSTACYKDENASWFRIPELLQTGLGAFGIKNRDRSRRKESSRSAAHRREERQLLNWVRLECITIFESNNRSRSRVSSDDGYVYNIEVAKLHTYVANGIVVHNCHHLTDENKWGTAVSMFPNALGLGVTATPGRADGKGLGRNADGVMDVMVHGPSMRELINQGYLTDYRIFAPPSDIDLSHVNIGASGDYSPKPLANAVHKSHIVGDVVEHYKRIAMGKLGVTFAVDVESATEIAQAYRNAGVPAEVVSAKTPDILRVEILRRFRNREILQLVNVDLFGEGFDLPAIEVVSMARPTQSYSLFVQQFGRALRPMDGKDYAIIIDHVGNTLRHGLPDAPREWSLDRRERRTRNAPTDGIPLRICTECLSAYERIYDTCPYCGNVHVPSVRSSPDAVDGDLHEMSPELLAHLRGEIDPGLKIPFGATPEIIGALKKRHRERQEAQTELRRVMSVWGGWRVTAGDSIAEQQRRFYYRFNVDVLSAQALGRADAETLTTKIRDTLDEVGIKHIDESVSNR